MEKKRIGYFLWFFDDGEIQTGRMFATFRAAVNYVRKYGSQDENGFPLWEITRSQYYVSRFRLGWYDEAPSSAEHLAQWDWDGKTFVRNRKHSALTRALQKRERAWFKAGCPGLEKFLVSLDTDAGGNDVSESEPAATSVTC